MDATIKNALGTITLSEDLIATIVGAAASENYGIVGMNSNSVGDAWFQLIGSENLKRGVKVTVNEELGEYRASCYAHVRRIFPCCCAECDQQCEVLR